MPWPTTRICTGCKEVFMAVECDVDVGHLWNLPKELAWACSQECGKYARENWLKLNVKPRRNNLTNP